VQEVIPSLRTVRTRSNSSRNGPSKLVSKLAFAWSQHLSDKAETTAPMLCFSDKAMMKE
jgi:hypothetical protein